MPSIKMLGTNRKGQTTIGEKNSKKFYSSRAWKGLRDAKMMECDGLCQDCMSSGLTVPATSVHHIKPFINPDGSIDWVKALDYDNLIPLCDECHHNRHNNINRQKKER